MLLKKIALAASFVLVLLLEGRAELLVIPFDRREGVIRNPLGQQAGRGADLTVAALDVVLKERERLARFQRFHPEGDLAQLDGHRVDVHTEDTSADDVPFGIGSWT